MWSDDFGEKLEKLKVPEADVRTGGEIVLAKRVAHRLFLHLVCLRNFVVSLIFRSGVRTHPPAPQNTF